MTCPLCDGKNSLDECNSFKDLKKKVYRKEIQLSVRAEIVLWLPLSNICWPQRKKL